MLRMAGGAGGADGACRASVTQQLPSCYLTTAGGGVVFQTVVAVCLQNVCAAPRLPQPVVNNRPRLVLQMTDNVAKRGAELCWGSGSWKLVLLLLLLLQEYADDFKLKALVSKYSEFINFPIFLQVCAVFVSSGVCLRR
jgi:hypothetical protein